MHNVINNYFKVSGPEDHSFFKCLLVWRFGKYRLQIKSKGSAAPMNLVVVSFIFLLRSCFFTGNNVLNFGEKEFRTLLDFILIFFPLALIRLSIHRKYRKVKRYASPEKNKYIVVWNYLFSGLHYEKFF